MRDFLPGDLVRRQFVAHRIRQIFESYGFLPLETPTIENLSALLGKYGDEGDQLLFRVLHRRDKLARALEKEEITEQSLAELGLRYDLTVPLARVMANYSHLLPRFFKRYQIQPVWRADRPGKGRFREFLQCDIDITGTKSLIAEAEVCSATACALQSLGINKFSIHINDRRLLRSMIMAAGIPAEMEGTALIAIDKLDKIGETNVRKELLNRSISHQAMDSIVELMSSEPQHDSAAALTSIQEKLASQNDANDSINDLRDLCALLEKTPAGPHVKVDLTLARGLGYYTGPIFEIRSPDFSGSLGGGGRYDGLIGMFFDREIPAVGFSLGFERLMLVMEDQGLFSQLQIGPDVLLCRFADVPATHALEIATDFRRQGLSVEVFPETPKIGKQLAYADSIGAKTAAILGQSEIESGEITLKHLSRKQQEKAKISEAAKILKMWVTSETDTEADSPDDAIDSTE